MTGNEIDPNQTLVELREHMRLAREDKMAPYHERQARWLMEKLDRWLSCGGAVPDAWHHSWHPPAYRFAIVPDPEHQTVGSYAYETEQETKEAERYELIRIASGEWLAYGVIAYEPCPDHPGWETCTHSKHVDSLWGIVTDSGHDGDYESPEQIQEPYLREIATDMLNAARQGIE